MNVDELLAGPNLTVEVCSGDFPLETRDENGRITRTWIKDVRYFVNGEEVLPEEGQEIVQRLREMNRAAAESEIAEGFDE